MEQSEAENEEEGASIVSKDWGDFGVSGKNVDEPPSSFLHLTIGLVGATFSLISFLSCPDPSPASARGHFAHCPFLPGSSSSLEIPPNSGEDIANNGALAW